MACSSPAPKETLPPPTGTLDQLLAPIALYPDPLLAQMLMSATNPSKVTELDKWLKSNAKLKGTALQDAAVKAGFDASFVALVLFPQVVSRMAEQIAWTRVLGQAFESDRSAVFASIQKLRKQAQTVGTLKTTPQQKVETKKTSAGEPVIVIEPANPQVVYVPQYNTEVVYTQAPTTTVIIQEEDDDDAAEAIAAGLIGFTAGIAIGAAMDNHYYYGPYGWHGGALHVQRRVGRLLRSTGKMRARIGSITAKTLSRNAAIGWRTSGRTGPTARRIHNSNAPTARRTGRKTGRKPVRKRVRKPGRNPTGRTGPTNRADDTGAKRLDTERERESCCSRGSSRPEQRDPGSAE